MSIHDWYRGTIPPVERMASPPWNPQCLKCGKFRSCEGVRWVPGYHEMPEDGHYECREGLGCKKKKEGEN